MPRKGRGQSGESGGAYQNRTDLAAPQARPQAVQVPTGQAYGDRQASIQQQQAQPLPQDNIDPFQKALQAASDHPFQPVGLNEPTQRPSEPITAGLSRGPGVGPEALGIRKGISDLLTKIYSESGNDTIAALLDRARQMGI